MQEAILIALLTFVVLSVWATIITLAVEAVCDLFADHSKRRASRLLI